MTDESKDPPPKLPAPTPPPDSGAFKKGGGLDSPKKRS